MLLTEAGKQERPVVPVAFAARRMRARPRHAVLPSRGDGAAGSPASYGYSRLIWTKGSRALSAFIAKGYEIGL
jgi:hypothetical protein